MLVLHSQHFAFTWLSTLVALDQWLLTGVVVCVLRMSHCKIGDINRAVEL